MELLSPPPVWLHRSPKSGDFSEVTSSTMPCVNTEQVLSLWSIASPHHVDQSAALSIASQHFADPGLLSTTGNLFTPSCERFIAVIALAQCRDSHQVPGSVVSTLLKYNPIMIPFSPYSISTFYYWERILGAKGSTNALERIMTRHLEIIT